MWAIAIAALMWNAPAALAGEPSSLHLYPPASQAQPPPGVVGCLTIVSVEFFNYKGQLTKGELVVNKDLASDVKKVFALIREIRFPVKSVQPIQNFGWSDDASMAADNTSAYNYRMITGGGAISFHALGRAIDINPFCNPYVRSTTVLPAGAVYDSAKPCALESEKGQKVIDAFRSLGWAWGGDSLAGVQDYQHFEKPGAHGRHSPYCASQAGGDWPF